MIWSSTFYVWTIPKFYLFFGLRCIYCSALSTSALSSLSGISHPTDPNSTLSSSFASVPSSHVLLISVNGAIKPQNRPWLHLFSPIPHPIYNIQSAYPIGSAFKTNLGPGCPAICPVDPQHDRPCTDESAQLWQVPQRKWFTSSS